jgi:hypothetical protein
MEIFLPYSLDRFNPLGYINYQVNKLPGNQGEGQAMTCKNCGTKRELSLQGIGCGVCTAEVLNEGQDMNSASGYQISSFNTISQLSIRKTMWSWA